MSGPQDATAASRDPGLQPERTALAWERTAVGALAVAVVVAAAWERLGGPAGALLGLALGAAGVAASLRQAPVARRLAVVCAVAVGLAALGAAAGVVAATR